MRYLFDTDICVGLIRRKSPALLKRARACAPGDLGISSITLAELCFGAAKSSNPRQNGEALRSFLAPFEVAPFEAGAAGYYGILRAELERLGSVIGPLDMLIAAHALSLNVVLITNNVREFRRVHGLRWENWL